MSLNRYCEAVPVAWSSLMTTYLSSLKCIGPKQYKKWSYQAAKVFAGCIHQKHVIPERIHTNRQSENIAEMSVWVTNWSYELQRTDSVSIVQCYNLLRSTAFGCYNMSKSIARQSTPTHQRYAFFFSGNSKTAPICSNSVFGSRLIKPNSQKKNRRLAYVDPDLHCSLLMSNNPR